MNAKVRAAVLRRAGGSCESCGRSLVHGGSVDHWEGGCGRRTQKESVESCWAICTSCDSDRTANRPSAAFWNERFAAHCERHGYPVLKHIVHQPVVTK